MGPFLKLYMSSAIPFRKNEEEHQIFYEGLGSLGFRKFMV